MWRKQSPQVERRKTKRWAPNSRRWAWASQISSQFLRLETLLSRNWAWSLGQRVQAVKVYKLKAKHRSRWDGESSQRKTNCSVFLARRKQTSSPRKVNLELWNRQKININRITQGLNWLFEVGVRRKRRNERFNVLFEGKRWRVKWNNDIPQRKNQWTRPSQKIQYFSSDVNWKKSSSEKIVATLS